MALTENGNMGTTMLVSPAGGMPYGNSGFGNTFGNDGWWLILLLLCFGGGWGNNGFANGYDNGLYPWMNQANLTSNGFQNQLMNDNITSIKDGVNNLSTQICGGFASVEQGANARQIANMQQSFANQTAMLQGFNNIQSQFADSCCENRLANCQTQNIIQNEGNATRFADANNTRDIIDATNRGNQMILDKLCQLELDGVKQNYENRIAGMQNVIDGLSAQVNAADRRVAMGEEVDALYNRLNNCPVPTTPVYGRAPIFQCNSNNGCGCNGGF